MSGHDKKRENTADALEALASGQQDAGGETSAQSSSGLMLLGEQETDEDTQAASDFMQAMAGESGEDSPELNDLASAAQRDSGALDDIAAASGDTSTPAFQAQRASRLSANSRRAHAHAYKRTMIPLLLVVGFMLIAFSVLTLMMLMGGGADDPDSLAGEMTYLQAYGKYFVLAALPLGAILLVGAWLFMIEIRKSPR